MPGIRDRLRHPDEPRRYENHNDLPEPEIGDREARRPRPAETEEEHERRLREEAERGGD